MLVEITWQKPKRKSENGNVLRQNNLNINQKGKRRNNFINDYTSVKFIGQTHQINDSKRFLKYNKNKNLTFS